MTWGYSVSAHSNGPENIFDANSLFLEAQLDILIIIYILGMDENLINSITIDEIIEKIKTSYDYRNAQLKMQAPMHSSYANDATAKLLRTECNSLLRRIRRAWFNKEFSMEVND